MGNLRYKQAIIQKGPDGVVEFFCAECPMKYADKESLELHLVMHNKEYRYLCGICGTGLKRREHLERHMLEHTDERPHVCPHCDRAFKRKEHLTIHKAIHSDQKKQSCPICPRAFHRKDHLQKHLETHINRPLKLKVQRGEIDFQSIKDEVPASPEDFNIVSEFVDVRQDAMEFNDVENNETVNTMAWTDDPNENRKVTDRPFVCSVCCKAFKKRNHLSLHESVHTKKEQVCRVCSKAFHKEYQLKYHLLLHMDNNEITEEHALSLPQQAEDECQDADSILLVERADYKPYICHVCGKRYKMQHHLYTHSKVHRMEELNFDKTDDATSEDNIQQVYVVPGSGDRVGNEEYQVAYEQNAIELLEPQTIMTVEEAIPQPRKVYVCKYCNKPFKRKDHFKIHQNVHTGIKNMFCPECGKGFYRKDHLQKHMSVHRDKPQTNMLKRAAQSAAKKEFKRMEKIFSPEITIRAPTNAKLDAAMQIKVPYQIVTTDGATHRSVVA